MKIKCFRMECEVCYRIDLIQVFYRSDGTAKYARARHYLGRVEGKPQFEYHIQNVSCLESRLPGVSLDSSLNSKVSIPIDLSLRNGQMGHINNGDLQRIEMPEIGSKFENRGRSSSLVRTLALRAKGRRFKSGSAHL